MKTLLREWKILFAHETFSHRRLHFWLRITNKEHTARWNENVVSGKFHLHSVPSLRLWKYDYWFRNFSLRVSFHFHVLRRRGKKRNVFSVNQYHWMWDKRKWRRHRRNWIWLWMSPSIRFLPYSAHFIKRRMILIEFSRVWNWSWSRNKISNLKFLIDSEPDAFMQEWEGKVSA